MFSHSIVSTAQVTVWMTLKNGVYYVPAVVNGIPLDFILDTGASDILISGTAVKSMLDAGVLTEEDFVGIEHYQIANGDIQEGYIVNLRNLFIGGVELNDLKATLSFSLDAPLLLGISTLNRFGRVEVDFDDNLLRLHDRGTKNATESFVPLTSFGWNTSQSVIEEQVHLEKWRVRQILGGIRDWKGYHEIFGKKWWYLKYKEKLEKYWVGKTYSFDEDGLNSITMEVLQQGVREGNPDSELYKIDEKLLWEIYETFDSFARNESRGNPEYCVSERFDCVGAYKKIISDDPGYITAMMEMAKEEGDIYYIKRYPIGNQMGHIELFIGTDDFVSYSFLMRLRRP